MAERLLFRNNKDFRLYSILKESVSPLPISHAEKITKAAKLSLRGESYVGSISYDKTFKLYKDNQMIFEK